ncbi:MAG TPA: hypothetical protein DDW94_11740 [Deltaproteobacteria bacterium]|nr:MAG: hypothetical protein A3I81_12355 [Deltaproteobacteria bacterium RIFCSPLOWO2_02_FULL_55_12]HBG47642.1 hypothetical protein [Deltaproteobacteria bacterium]HCY10553.1 hypothetical protein [Deltaproteobacteria bacterium]
MVSHLLNSPLNNREYMQFMVESLRGHHTNKGDSYYWDPVNGNDANDGISEKSAVKTFAQAHSLCADWGHDAIYLSSTNSGGVFYIDENISITKNWLSLRGPGFDARIRPTTALPSGAAVEVLAEGVQMTGLHLDVSLAGANVDGIRKDGKYFHFSGVIVKGASRRGIYSVNGHGDIYEKFSIKNCGTDGIDFGNNNNGIDLLDGYVDNCGDNGVNITGTDNHDVRLKDGMTLHGNGEYGLKVGGGAEDTYIAAGTVFLGNGLGEIDDSGVDTHRIVLAKEATVNNNTDNLFNLIEYQRGTHTGRGRIFYWNPIGGNDSNDGLTPSTAKLTWAGVNALVVAYRHDIVIGMPGDIGATTQVDTFFDMNKAFTLLRGPGRDLKIKTTSTANNTVTISAPGCEISGFIIETANSGSKDAISIQADFALVRKVWVDYSRGHGIASLNGSHALIDDVVIQDAAQGGSGHAISIKSTSGNAVRNVIRNTRILSNDGDGIRFDGANTQNNYVFAGEKGTAITQNTGYGINELNGADNNHIIGPGLIVEGNTSGDINLTGANSETINCYQYLNEATNEASIAATKVMSELLYKMERGRLKQTDNPDGSKKYEYFEDNAETQKIIEFTVDSTGKIRSAGV